MGQPSRAERKFQTENTEFMRSEAAVIIAKNAGNPSDIPSWITNEQRERFSSLTEEEKQSVLTLDTASRIRD
jgi:hypothetical protein